MNDPTRPWYQAQAIHASLLADTALELGRLDGMLAAMPFDTRFGARRRLALIEAEEMAWAQGTPVARDEIGRDLMDARTGTDLEALAQARWAQRRLEGQGPLDDLRAFLGLRRNADLAPADHALTSRSTGAGFDEAARAFLGDVEALSDLHPLIRAPLHILLWRQAGLSGDDMIIEAAVWSGRAMTAGSEGVVFAPLGRQGRSAWAVGGVAEMRVMRHLQAVRSGARDARMMLVRLSVWTAEAMAWAQAQNGPSPERVIEVLAAHPLSNAALIETRTGLSRITVERILTRLHAAGLVRELTGATRFRLWEPAS